MLHRHALYLILRMVCYDDGLGAGKGLLALKTTDASNEEYSLWVYQCGSLVRAVARGPQPQLHVLLRGTKTCG